MMLSKKLIGLVVLAVLTVSTLSAFEEFPMGEEQTINHMLIAGVYFQSVDMEPAGRAGLSQSDSDVHIEADIHATRGNPYGFSAGDWVPYMTVEYKLENLSNGKSQSGTFMPMSASDGPHYGGNVKMTGYGNYRCTFTIYAPDKNGYLQHVDAETGIESRFWTQPVVVTYEFRYDGL